MRDDSAPWTMVISGLTRLYIAFGFGMWALVAYLLRPIAPNELQRQALSVAAPLLAGIAAVLEVYGSILFLRATRAWLQAIAFTCACFGAIWGATTVLWQLPFAEDWNIEEAYAILSIALALAILILLLQTIRQGSVPDVTGRRAVMVLWWATLTISAVVFAAWFLGRHGGFTRMWIHALSGAGIGGVFLFSFLVMSVRRLLSDVHARTSDGSQ